MQHVMIVGGVVLDLSFIVKAWPQRGGVVDLEHFVMAAGGKGLNQAYACQRLGAEVDLVACRGDDMPGLQIAEAMTRRGLNQDFIKIEPDASTNVVGILLQGGEPAFMGMVGANHRLEMKDLQPALARLKAGDVLLVNYEVRADVTNAALRAAKAKGAITILNPAPLHNRPPDIAPPYELLDYLVPNVYEAQLLLGSASEDPAQLAAALLGLGVGGLVLTAGAEGCIAATREHPAPYHVPSIAIEAVDSTGASDAFCGMLASKIGSLPLAEVLRLANLAGAAACLQPGALDAMPSLETIDALQDRYA